MDLKDKKLLYWLDLNSRMSASDLAKKVGTTKQVVGYRIAKLTNLGVIKKFQTMPSFNSLDLPIYANIYFKLVASSKSKEEEIINYLINNKKIGYVASTGGRFDLSIVLVARDFQQLDRDITNIIKLYSSELMDYELSLRLKGIKFHKKYLLQEKVIKQKELLKQEETSLSIDELDSKIMKLLSDNSRVSIVAIGEKLKIPFSTVRLRIRNLESRGIIAGYSTLLDLTKMGMLNYKIFIKTKDKTEDFSNRLFSFALNNKNITWFFKTFGNHDYELRVEAENQEKYQDIIRELRSEFTSSISEIETLMVFNELKEDFSVVF